MRTIPKPSGLYDPRLERDACGIGFLVNIRGDKSHAIIRGSLEILENLAHRGACGCEANTGDGAGILFQLPHRFFHSIRDELGFAPPRPGRYGVGMLFVPKDAGGEALARRIVEEAVGSEGQKVLGWRAVPCDNSDLGASAVAGEPAIRQVFVGSALPDGQDASAFERTLFVIRKRIENAARSHPDLLEMGFYVASFSSRTIVYKGMLMSEQVEGYYSDLKNPAMDSALALVHSRFSTNTFPSWNRAHPYRYAIHNGEINTLRGNVNWMQAREAVTDTGVFGTAMASLRPILDEGGSDSAIFDNCLEFLVLGGRSLSHALMMMIPEPWEQDEGMDPDKRAFYEYHSTIMEPWDGPASIVATDGEEVVAVLDRNGLRPSRYWVTEDDTVILASEVGVLQVPQDRVRYKGRLEPGRMLRIDTRLGRIVPDEELKRELATAHPYGKWLRQRSLRAGQLPGVPAHPGYSADERVRRLRAFGYTYEDLQRLLGPMARQKKDPVGSMGNDTPLAVFSDQPQLLFNYFKQLFAQVTNPPIDAIREELITASDVLLGAHGDLLNPGPEHAHQLRLPHPILTDAQMASLRASQVKGLRAGVLDTLFPATQGPEGLASGMEALFSTADKAVEAGCELLVLSDRGADANRAPIPSLLAVAGVHHHLIRNGLRMRTSIAVEAGDAREVHHFCLLLGYGAAAINPYLAYESLRAMIESGELPASGPDEAIRRYIHACVKGIIKVLSKMGISTVASYSGAQIFEAIGLSRDFVDRYFTWTPSRIEGIGLEEVGREALLRHADGFGTRSPVFRQTLEAGGRFNWRSDGERHLFNPKTIHALQKACRNGDFEAFREYTMGVNEQTKHTTTLRGLLDFKFEGPGVPLEEVESEESICHRFKTGAMSYGSISAEAHESLAIAMNRVGGKSNTGEGGEDPRRFKPDDNGDLRRSAIKQVASGRFGVSSEYLVNADEIQIKIAQGAKPGEGGQLPGAKVYPWIAKVRNSTPGVELISPPPHHDIYSIEDLAQLIHDLKNANPRARINVKLVSEVGVGTIAAGVAKGHADVVLISGHDGGTGASPVTSIYHAGLPWELGLAETHQTLVLNNLRSRIVVETDGQLKTGRDVVIATLLGAEEFGFATAPLVVLGCIMMRKCHLGTCPVGVATQNPELRKKFTGDPAHVVHFMRFIAREARELMAKLGFRTINEMVGRVDKLEQKRAHTHWKARGVDLSALLRNPQVPSDVGRYCSIAQDHGLEKSLDMRVLLNLCAPALERGERVEATLPITNVDRVVGTLTGSELTRRYGSTGLPEDTIRLRFKGSAGQSFCAFVPPGMSLFLEGDANDYVGKGLSGGKLVVYPPRKAHFVAHENVLIGNVALYGATGGEAYFRGLAGERFAVRNSGTRTVVEGVGDHGCEYMTGGRVVVLGPTGKNFAAGMSGGIAYVYDPSGRFASNCNRGMVDLVALEDALELVEVKELIRTHVDLTGSDLGRAVIEDWPVSAARFVKVFPRDYKRVLEATQAVESRGLTGDEAVLAAFHESLESA